MEFIKHFGIATTIRNIPLVDAASSTGAYKANPTLAVGDVKVSIDGGALSNIGTLPSATPASGRGLLVTLTAAEMSGSQIRVEFVDAAGGEWADQFLIINTQGDFLRANACQAGGSTTTALLDSGASATDDVYNGLGITLYQTNGTGIVHNAIITDYVGATKTVTFTPAAGFSPIATTVFEINQYAGSNVVAVGGVTAVTSTASGGFSRGGGSSMGISGSSGHRKMLATDSTQADFVSGTPLANGYRSDVTNSSGTLIIASLANWPIVLLNGYAGAWITFLGDANNATYDYRLWQVMGSYGSGKKLPGADPFSDLDGIELSCVGYGAVTLGTATTAGAVLGTTYKVADTVTFTAATSATTPPGFMSQLATTYGQPTPAAYSPADNTVAKLFVPNFSQGALGFVLEFDLGTATYANAEYTLTL